MAQKVAAGVYKGVTTTELDELAAETAAGMTSAHPDYAVVRRPCLTAPRRGPPPRPPTPPLARWAGLSRSRLSTECRWFKLGRARAALWPWHWPAACRSELPV